MEHAYDHTIDLLPMAKARGFLPHRLRGPSNESRATRGRKRRDPPTAVEVAMDPNYRPDSSAEALPGRILSRCMPRRASSHAPGTNLHYSALAGARGSRTPRHRARPPLLGPRLTVPQLV